MARIRVFRLLWSIVAVPVTASMLFVGLMALDSRTAAFCDGSYELTIEIDAEASAGLKDIAYVGAGSHQLAEDMLLSIDEYLETMKHKSSASLFVVPVGFSYRESMLGHKWGHTQEYSDLIVVLFRHDGSRSVHRLPIPHRADSRLVFVTTDNAL